MKVLVLGNGQLATSWLRHLPSKIQIHGYGGHLSSPATEEQILIDTISSLVKTARIKAVINTRALVNVDMCENEKCLATYLNSSYASASAKICRDMGLKYILISTDHVYGGTKFLNTELDADPKNYYAESKLDGEERTLSTNPDSLVLRVNPLSWGMARKSSFTQSIYQKLTNGNAYTALCDAYFSPSSPSSLYSAISNLLDIGANGVFNYGMTLPTSKYSYAQALRAHLENQQFSNLGNVIPTSYSELCLGVARPPLLGLSCSKYIDSCGTSNICSDLSQLIAEVFALKP